MITTEWTVTSSMDYYTNTTWTGVWTPDKPTTSEYTGSPSRHAAQLFFETVFLVIIWLVTILGNILVCLVIHRSRRLQSTTNYFVVSLACSDLALALLCMPFVLGGVLAGHWPFGQFMCKLVRFIQYVLPACSMYVLVSICVDRFYTILYPLSFKVTRCRAKQMIAGSWMTAVVLASPCFYLYTVREDGLEPGQCGSWLGDSWNTVLYVYLVTTGSYLVPAVVAVVGYSRISRYIWRAGVGGRTFQRTMNPVPRAKVKMVKMIMFLSGSYTVLLLPYFAAQLWYCSVAPRATDAALYITVVWFSFSTAASKPAIYMLYNSNFRRGCREVFCMSTMRCYRGNAYTITTTSALGKKNHVGVLDASTFSQNSTRRLDSPSKTFNRAEIIDKNSWPISNNMLSTYL